MLHDTMISARTNALAHPGALEAGPLRLARNDLPLASYVASDPINNIDPFGLAKCTPSPDSDDMEVCGDRPDPAPAPMPFFHRELGGGGGADIDGTGADIVVIGERVRRPIRQPRQRLQMQASIARAQSAFWGRRKMRMKNMRKTFAAVRDCQMRADASHATLAQCCATPREFLGGRSHHWSLGVMRPLLLP